MMRDLRAAWWRLIRGATRDDRRLRWSVLLSVALLAFWAVMAVTM
jgi:hypothetical protein